MKRNSFTATSRSSKDFISFPNNTRAALHMNFFCFIILRQPIHPPPETCFGPLFALLGEQSFRCVEARHTHPTRPTGSYRRGNNYRVVWVSLIRKRGTSCIFSKDCNTGTVLYTAFVHILCSGFAHVVSRVLQHFLIHNCFIVALSYLSQ